MTHALKVTSTLNQCSFKNEAINILKQGQLLILKFFTINLSSRDLGIILVLPLPNPFAKSYIL